MEGIESADKSQQKRDAAEADDLLAVIADEAAKNVGGRPKQRQEPEHVEPQQKIVAVSSNRNVTDTKAAELFNTNRTQKFDSQLRTTPPSCPL